METYRRGRNETDSKSVCPKGHAGSNLFRKEYKYWCQSVRIGTFFVESMVARMAEVSEKTGMCQRKPKRKNMVLYVQLRPIRSKKSESLGHFFGTSGHLRGHLGAVIVNKGYLKET